MSCLCVRRPMRIEAPALTILCLRFDCDVLPLTCGVGPATRFVSWQDGAGSLLLLLVF